MRMTVVLAIIVLGACSSSIRSDGTETAVSLDVRPDAVSTTDSVVLTLSNESSATIGYNLCTSALERMAGNEWEAVPSDRVCTMELRTLAPDAQTQYGLDVPDGLAPGDYRYRTTIEIMGTAVRRALTSDTFAVR